MRGGGRRWQRWEETKNGKRSSSRRERVFFFELFSKKGSKSGEAPSPLFFSSLFIWFGVELSCIRSSVSLLRPALSPFLPCGLAVFQARRALGNVLCGVKEARELRLFENVKKRLQLQNLGGEFSACFFD